MALLRAPNIISTRHALRRLLPDFSSIKCRQLSMTSSDTIFSGSGAADLRARKPVIYAQCSSTPLIGKEDLQQALIALPAWRLEKEGTQISRKFVAKNFVAAVKFFEDVARLAEEANHHPDLHLTGYRNVEVVLTTHSIGGLGETDLILAAKIDSMDIEYSPKWLKEQEDELAAKKN